MKRREVCLMGAGAAAWGVLGRGGRALAQPASFQWNVPLIWTPPHPVRAEQDVFRQQVYERTGQRIDIGLFQYGELGLVDSDVLSIVRTNQFPVAELEQGKTGGDEPFFLIYQLPGLVFRIEDARTIDAAIAGLHEQALGDWNAMSLGMVHYMAPQGLFTRTPVHTVDDLKGMKIRVYSSVLANAMARLGARPELIPWADTPAALLQGVVDGAITSPSSGVSVGLGDVTKYMTVMPIGNRASWIINKDTWATVAQDDQDILHEEAAAASIRLQANWQAEEDGVQALVEGAGMTYVPATPEFEAGVTERLRPVWDEWASTSKYGPEALKLALEALGRA